MSHYCTLAEAKRELKAESAADDVKLFAYVGQVSARVDLIMGRGYFEPTIEQKLFMVESSRIETCRRLFYLRKPLLAFSEVLLDDVEKTDDVEQFPLGISPFTALRLTEGDWYACNGRTPIYVSVTGTWGFHRDYANAFAQVDTLQQAMNASTTSMKVADIDGLDIFGLTPRFSKGTLAKIGDEFMRVVDTDIATNIATVTRGVNGSTAAAHDNGSALSVWQVEPPIVHCVARQAALFYARRGAFEIQTLDAVGIQQYPQDLMLELRATLTEYANV
jgi:hypothetical protein